MIWIEINLLVRLDLKRNGYLFDMMKKKINFYYLFLLIIFFIFDDLLYINLEYIFLV